MGKVYGMVISIEVKPCLLHDIGKYRYDDLPRPIKHHVQRVKLIAYKTRIIVDNLD